MITNMSKITFVGVEADKEVFLRRLQEVGAVHLLLPQEPLEPGDLVRELARVRETRKFLVPKAGPGAVATSLDAREVCDRREALGLGEAGLQSRMAALKKELAALEAWGDFDLAGLQSLEKRGMHMQFFRASAKLFAQMPLEGVFHREIRSRKNEVHFVTVSTRPLRLEAAEEKLPGRDLSRIREELGVIEVELGQIGEQYRALATRRETLEEKEIELSDLLEYRRALMNLSSELDARLFVLRCWSPLSEGDLLAKLRADFTLYHCSEPAGEEERVPVLLQNGPAFNPGEDLVGVYSFPSYRDFDPSGFVLYFFTIFFGMIIGDAGYGLSLLALTVLLRWKLRNSSALAKRLLRLMFLCSISVILYGVLTAGYFGASLSEDGFLWRLSLLDMNSKQGQDKAVLLSILIGMAHISLSFLIRFRKTRDYAALGWIGVIWSGYSLISGELGGRGAHPAALWVFIGSLVAVFFVSSHQKNPLLRVLEGLNGLLGIVQVFSDVLSYLRLFALGIATVYMAQTFNMLARDISAAVPWVGYLLATLVLVAGHIVNLVLGVMGGVIHGLRLNFLEWYRWSFNGDGLAYKPFCLKKSREGVAAQQPARG